MNILYLSTNDIIGQQFNGYLLHELLRREGFTTNMIVARKGSNRDGIYQTGNHILDKIDTRLVRIETALGLSSLLFLSSSPLFHRTLYRTADIIHLQLLHALPFYSLLNVPVISRKRPVVWTMHDPWMLSGHCVHPLGCDRWLTGCGKCPDLSLPIALQRDTTAFMWKVKKYVMHHSHITLIVTSAWMRQKLRLSPILSHLPTAFIPFGVDPATFRPREKAACRSRFGIPPDAHVIMFRNAPFYIYKGSDYAIKALELFSPYKPTYILTMDTESWRDSVKDTLFGCSSIKNKYRFVELGWVNDRDLLVDALNAADIFLMPSIAETFGMMAVESMACGTPVIVFEGTSLPDVIHAPKAGIAVPYKDYRALAEVLADLLSRPAKLRTLSENALSLVREEYTIDLYVKRHIDLYETLSRK